MLDVPAQSIAQHSDDVENNDAVTDIAEQTGDIIFPTSQEDNHPLFSYGKSNVFIVLAELYKETLKHLRDISQTSNAHVAIVALVIMFLAFLFVTFLMFITIAVL